MKHVRNPIALLLALVLAASLLCLPALAADTVPARYARYRVYTCLGDSNAAGYAAEGLSGPAVHRDARRVPLHGRRRPRRQAQRPRLGRFPQP